MLSKPLQEWSNEPLDIVKRMKDNIEKIERTCSEKNDDSKPTYNDLVVFCQDVLYSVRADIFTSAYIQQRHRCKQAEEDVAITDKDKEIGKSANQQISKSANQIAKSILGIESSKLMTAFNNLVYFDNIISMLNKEHPLESLYLNLKVQNVLPLPQKCNDQKLLILEKISHERLGLNG